MGSKKWFLSLWSYLYNWKTNFQVPQSFLIPPRFTLEYAVIHSEALLGGERNLHKTWKLVVYHWKQLGNSSVWLHKDRKHDFGSVFVLFLKPIKGEPQYLLASVVNDIPDTMGSLYYIILQSVHIRKMGTTASSRFPTIMYQWPAMVGLTNTTYLELLRDLMIPKRE